MPYPNISVSLLQEKNVCKPTIKVFKRIFKPGTRVKLSRTLAVRYAKFFNWTWASNHFLTRRDQNKFDKRYNLSTVDFYQRGGDGLKGNIDKWRQDIAVAFVEIYIAGMK